MSNPATATTHAHPLRLAVALRSIRPARLVAILFAAHVALKLALLPIAVRTPLQGDEVTYDAGAQSIATALRSFVSGNGLPTAGMQENVIGHGWFMPGMSTLLTPLYLLAPDASVAAVRVYVGVLTLALFAAAVLVIFRIAPWQFAAALIVVPGLVPLWVLYSFTTWGDLTAGIVLIIVVAFLTWLWKRLVAGDPLRLRDAAALGALLGATLYLRSSTLPLIAGLLVLCAIAVVCHTRGRQLLRGLIACGLAALVLVAMILPWSYAASRAFDSRVTTTTTLPLSLAFAFGDRDELCFGPCPPGEIWYSMTRFSRGVAERTGESELDVQRRMSDYALRNVTLSSYATHTLDNFDRYVFQPTGYEPIFRMTAVGHDPVKLKMHEPNLVSQTDVGVTKILYFGTLLLAAISILLVRRTPVRVQVVGILASLITAALMMQPFVHVSSPRYWPVFLPMLSLLAASLLIRRDDAESSPVLRRVQIAVAAIWVAVPLVLIGLATF